MLGSKSWQAGVGNLWTLGVSDAGMYVDGVVCAAGKDGFGIGEQALRNHNPVTIVRTDMHCGVALQVGISVPRIVEQATTMRLMRDGESEAVLECQDGFDVGAAICK